jgi:hypothetical protein
MGCIHIVYAAIFRFWAQVMPSVPYSVVVVVCPELFGVVMLGLLNAFV